MLLALALVVCWLPADVFAWNAVHTHPNQAPQRIDAYTDIYFNPLYGESDVTRTPAGQFSTMQTTTEESHEYTTSLQELAENLRQGMVERKGTVALYYQVTNDAFDGTQETMNVLSQKIFREAVEHTGAPKEGDSLRWVCSNFFTGFRGELVDGYWMLVITYYLDYYTMANREADLDAAVEQVLASFAFTEETTDYEKVKTIYDYICANVTYDYEHLENESYVLKYTAYAALVKGTAVCQGYALLMYRLLLEVGVDCRLIGGQGNGGGHAWNIVKLGNHYYNMDSTWDAGCTEYSYFLRCEDNFDDHIRDEEYTTAAFMAQYPMDSADYHSGNAGGENKEYTTSLQEAAAILRQGLVAHQKEIKVYYQISDTEFDGSEDACKTLIRAIFNAAVAHTGAAKEGDTLRWLHDGYSTNISFGSADGFWQLTLTYSPRYYTTAEQEAAVDAKVAQVLESFAFTEETTDYEKVKAIYDYVCANVTYDNGHLADDTYLLKYTAYAALINGTSVCQGYALLMYRLLLEVGIDSRVIMGEANGGAHAWNIVKLGDYYYDLDSTWDAGWVEYGYFLRGEGMLGDHIRNEEYTTEDFMARYPMSPTDYVPDQTGDQPHIHQYVAVVTPPTCYSQGYTTYTCACGDSYVDSYVTGTHNYIEYVTEVTCTDFGYTDRTCEFCGDTYRTSYVNPTGHTLGEDFLCTVCGRPEYMFNSNLYVRNLVLDENGIYHNAYGDVVYVAVTLQLDQWTIDHTLANQVHNTGEPWYSLTYWDQIMASLNEDGCMLLTSESLVWILDLLKGNSTSGPEDWRLNYFLCYVLDHNHEYTTVTTPPTCTELGLIETYCIHCGLVTESEWIGYQHSYDDGVVVPATCTSNGYTIYTCTICGDYYMMDYTPYADHTYGEEGVVTPPTCSSEGYTTYTCTQCDNQIQTDYLPPVDHIANENCVCIVCGTKVYLVDIGLELDMMVLGTDGVYYTEYGDMVMIAITAPLELWLSGYSLADYVEYYGKTYFSMTYWKSLLAVTNADGYAPLTTETLVWMLDLITGNPNWGEDETYLKYYLGFAVDHPHIYDTKVVEPTCTELGYTVHTCSECGISVWEDWQPPLEHSLNEHYVCTVCGIKIDYVLECGLTVEDLILGENGIYYTAEGYMAVIAVDAPLEYWLGGNSLAEYVYVYGESYFSLTYWYDLLAAADEDGFVPLTPETLVWILDVITGNPQWGDSVYDLTHYIGICIKCDHNYEAIVTGATCIQGGYTTHICTSCGHSYVDTYTDPVDHHYVDGVCEFCGEQAEQEILLGDVNGDGAINTRDAKLIMQYELGLLDASQLDLVAADVNGDGAINTRDAKLIMQFELGLIAQLPGKNGN